MNEHNCIDLYLIAGQSNAAGYSLVRDAESAYAWAPELKNGFSNVHYAGDSRADAVAEDYAYVVHRQIDWQPTVLGLGVRNERFFGPEAGMAKALSAVYNRESGRHAGIIKFAHGGTTIFDSAVRGNRHGNWVSPSYAADLGVEFSDRVHTGGLYRGLLAEVEKQIGALYAYGGFQQVRLKGLYWMQGEGTRMFPSEYRKAFVFWAKDIRRDLAELMRKITGGDDCGASDLPIFVGAISATFALESASTEDVYNRPFVEMQFSLEKLIPNCRVVDNSSYAIGRWDAEKNACVTLGTDQFHWNQADMLAIGENVGNAMLKVR